jgi:hypothetical protein
MYYLLFIYNHFIIILFNIIIIPLVDQNWLHTYTSKTFADRHMGAVIVRSMFAPQLGDTQATTIEYFGKLIIKININKMQTQKSTSHNHLQLTFP